MTTDIITRQRDFILAGEDEEYAQTFTALMAELAPGSILEQTFATEIMGANWRLRRCRNLEFDLARSANPEPDAEAAIQQSIDRARAQSHQILRRSLTELRKLQTERHARILQSPVGGAIDSSEAVKTATETAHAKIAARVADIEAECRRREQAIDEYLAARSFCKPAKSAPATPANPVAGSFCNPPATPRNALCPCGSGAKYKRCCGTNAPPVLNRAA
jgi:hypothetical protein